MALDALKGEAALDAVADLIDPVFAIAQDPAFRDLFTAKECPEGTEPGEFVLSRVRRAAPGLIRAHKDELVRIMAATQGRPVEEVKASLTVFSLPVWLVQALNDPVLLGFLASLGETADAVRSQPSGSPSASTEAPAGR